MTIQNLTHATGMEQPIRVVLDQNNRIPKTVMSLIIRLKQSYFLDQIKLLKKKMVSLNILI
jgi:riboflavin biosynthesis pyrimidine reductase